MTQQQQINDATDAEHYIARLKNSRAVFAEVIADLKIRESKGILPPKFAVAKALDQIRDFTRWREQQSAGLQFARQARQVAG